jgi:hypothetical protein
MMIDNRIKPNLSPSAHRTTGGMKKIPAAQIRPFDGYSALAKVAI